MVTPFDRKDILSYEVQITMIKTNMFTFCSILWRKSLVSFWNGDKILLFDFKLPGGIRAKSKLFSVR